MITTSRDIERLLLGALLSGGDPPPLLTENHFQVLVHKKIFLCIKQLTKPDLALVWLKMSENGWSEMGGGLVYLSGLTSDLPAIPWEEIVSDCFLKLDSIYKNELLELSKTPGPQSLEESPPDWVASKIRDIVLDTSGKKPQLKPDWHIKILEADKILANSYKFDYTIGVPVTTYPNTSIYKTAILLRIHQCGIPTNLIKDNDLSRIADLIQKKNSQYSNILDFIDRLQVNGSTALADVLQPLIDAISFQDQDKKNEYKELLHLFFLKMHLRLKGCRKNDRGEFGELLPNDIVPVLEGPQGIGKTTLCQWLAMSDRYYIDLGSGLRGSFGDEETVKKVRGKLIAELGEMRIMKKESDVEQVKSFISKTTYEPNIKYVEHAEPLPATVSFIATSNPEQYLSDETGNRRFYPIHIKKIDLDWLHANKFWAKKIHAYYADLANKITSDELYEKLKPSENLSILMTENRSAAIIEYSDVSAIGDVVADYIVTCRDRGYSLQDNPLNQHVIERLLTESGFGKTLITRRGIRAALEPLGFTHERRQCNGAKRWGWYLKTKN
jgi:hypothetical protein